jgi:polysaccharide biosynthesis/export protein ExoF
MTRSGVRIVVALALLLKSPLCLLAAPDYTLGPGERVQVRVSGFHSGGEAYQWPGYEGGADFVVGPNGRLSLPIVGAVQAEGKTTEELEDEIAAKLQAKAGLIAPPHASVQIVRFRPFYVVGAVDKPGEYEYRPGLTVLQAFGVAGGAQRANSQQLIGLEKDALNSRGDLRVLSVDRISLMARQAGLQAEIADKPQVEFPEELRTKASDPDVARVIREEQLLFDSRRAGLAKPISALEQTKTSLLDEIATLQQKSATIDKELVAMRQEREIIIGLLKRGLTGNTRQLELDQSIAQIEGNQLDVQVAMERASEDLSKADRDIADLKSKFMKDALEANTAVRDKLAQTIEKIETSRTLIDEAEMRAPNMTLPKMANYAKPTYLRSRRGKDGKLETLAVQENDGVEPGDVIRVIPQNGESTTPRLIGEAN